MNKKQIEKKLDQLQTLLDNIEEARFLNPDDPDTWDSDPLYNLAENLKAALKLLEDQPLKGQDELNNSLYEDGLCSLIDSYYEEEEDYD